MRHIKLFSALLPLVLACSLSLRAQEAPVYFSAEELPDLIKCLPAPPAKGTPGFRYDEQRYKWGKAQRKDLQRAGQACRDAVWTYDALIDELDGPFGMTLSKDGTPALWFLLDRSLRTIDQIRVEPKAWFHRIRPFEYYKEKTLTGEDEELRGEGSYPSGHTIRSWLVALLLSEINPAAANDIYARAWEYGESRVIAGAHWQTDVDASRVAASIGYSSLQASPVFKEDMARAREEYARLLVGRDFFVPITDVVPDAILEIRYYSTYNFVGARIDGYDEPIALMTRQAADSLRAVSDDLKARGYRIKIYDAYRPQMAVDHFVRWAADRTDTLMKSVFYPEVDKSLLFEQEYIMARSGHSRGSTVDLTLVDSASGREVDMGGVFDWFGGESHPDYRGITDEQYANRMLLREVMLAHGFKPLDSEWWHFTLKDEPFPDTYFNFPVTR